MMDDHILKVRDLHKSYGHQQVLDGVTCSIRRNEHCVLIGPSGGGKSTLLRCIMGLEDIDSGKIEFKGRDYVYCSQKKTIVDKKLKLRVGMVFQQYNLFPHLTVLQNCTLGPIKVQKINEKEAVEKAKRVLESVGLYDKVNEYPNRLSGGQRQRAAIARSLVMEPELMLFDEITSALDPELIKGVLDLLAEVAAQGMTMLIITHEMDFAIRMADKVIFLDEGKIMDAGPADLISNPQKERTKVFLDHFSSRLIG
jgi:polar amino acid transport system ATP-binding protein